VKDLLFLQLCACFVVVAHDADSKNERTQKRSVCWGIEKIEFDSTAGGWKSPSRSFSPSMNATWESLV